MNQKDYFIIQGYDTISDLSDEYFNQTRNSVTFVGSEDVSTFIEDNFMLDSNIIVHNFARLLFKYAETYINTRNGAITGFVSMIVPKGGLTFF